MDSFRSVGKIRVFLYQMHSVVARMLSRNVLRGGNRKENLALLRLNSVFFFFLLNFQQLEKLFLTVLKST